MNTGKKYILSRNFVFFDSLDNYYKLLENKILMGRRNFDKDNMKSLFDSLKKLEKEDINSYNHVIDLMANYTEEFVLKNSKLFCEMINMNNNSIEPLLNDFGFSNKFDAIDTLNIITGSYTAIVHSMCDEIIEDLEISQMSETANILSEDEGFINKINIAILEEYPVINNYLVLQELLISLTRECPSIISSYIIDVRNSKKIVSEGVYNKYIKVSTAERARRIARGHGANPPLGISKFCK